MQALKPKHKQYILEHELDIRKGNWEKFFKSEKYPVGIGEPLYLSNVPFMEELRYVPRGAFFECTGLTSITIPKGVTSIESSAFNGCTGLTSVTIPDSVISIGSSAFSGCSGLTSINIPASVQSVDSYAFEYCSGLTSVTIPESVTSISEFTFSGCENLTSITIPASVTYVGDYAFESIPTDLVVTYDGTKEQWNQICNKHAFEDTHVTVNCTDGKLIKKR